MASMLILLTSLGCGSKVEATHGVMTENGNNIDEQSFNYGQARQISDTIVSDIISNNNQTRLWEETSKNTRIDQDEYNAYANKIFETFGRPLEAHFKRYEFGTETNVNGTNPSATFWYAVKTTKFDAGKCYLVVDVASVNKVLLGEGYSIVTFPLGVPADLK